MLHSTLLDALWLSITRALACLISLSRGIMSGLRLVGSWRSGGDDPGPDTGLQEGFTFHFDRESRVFSAFIIFARHIAGWPAWMALMSMPTAKPRLFDSRASAFLRDK